jgi:hypothetical protein
MLSVFILRPTDTHIVRFYRTQRTLLELSVFFPLQKYAYHILFDIKFIRILYSFDIETVLEALLSITLAGGLAATFVKWV